MIHDAHRSLGESVLFSKEKQCTKYHKLEGVSHYMYVQRTVVQIYKYRVHTLFILSKLFYKKLPHL